MTRQEWAAHLIQRGGNSVPEYGSPAFMALPDGHPTKLASLTRAAECWARDGDDLERRLRTEVLALSKSNKELEDAEYVDQMRSGRVRRLPSSAELEAEYWDWIRGVA